MPSLVAELPTDDLKPFLTKMRKYLKDGMRLGWLIRPKTQPVKHLSIKECAVDFTAFHSRSE